MKRALVILSFLMVTNAFSQELKMYKTFGGLEFYRDTTQINSAELSEILRDYPESIDILKKANRKNTLSGILGFTGFLMASLPLANAIAGGEADWRLAAGGGLLVLGSIPLHRSYRAYTLHALDLYNTKPPTRIKPNLYFYITGAKLELKF